MITASEIRLGNILRVEGKTAKVISQEIKGTGKFGKTVHVRLKMIEDGRVTEKSYRAEEKVEDVEVRVVKLQYLYRDGDRFVFMNGETFDQVSLPAKTVGKQEIFLKENSETSALFEGDKPLSIDFPKTVDLKVVSAPPGVKGQADTTYKEVELENGLKILAPQFVKEGETVRVDIENLSYHERLAVKSMKVQETEKASSMNQA